MFRLMLVSAISTVVGSAEMPVFSTCALVIVDSGFDSKVDDNPAWMAELTISSRVVTGRAIVLDAPASPFSMEDDVSAGLSKVEKTSDSTLELDAMRVMKVVYTNVELNWDDAVSNSMTPVEEATGNSTLMLENAGVSCADVTAARSEVAICTVLTLSKSDVGAGESIVVLSSTATLEDVASSRPSEVKTLATGAAVLSTTRSLVTRVDGSSGLFVVKGKAAVGTSRLVKAVGSADSGICNEVS